MTIYTTNTLGVKTLPFRTREGDSSETIRVAAQRFIADVFVRSCDLLDFTARYDQVPGLTVGTPVGIVLTIPAGYDWTSNGDQCVVTFYPQRILVPRTGSQALFDEINDVRYGTGYNYTVAYAATTPGAGGTRTITIPFQTIDRYNDIRTVIESPGFNSINLTAQRTGQNWNFAQPSSILPKPRDNNSTSEANRMMVSFTLNANSVSPTEPVNVTFVASYLVVSANQNARANSGGNTYYPGNIDPSQIIINDGYPDANRTMTITGLTTAGPHRFYVQNTTTDQTPRRTEKVLKARYYNNSANLNN